ncbi:hypothetical protein ACFSTE_09505 [Aquimarina hainanensis]|uniref:Rad52/22 family double-strand break repair protein n=1 Tax=Aquimarina hainanensis TaxID=1578017 RepID=A0ABW5N7G5_9FLAO
MEYNLLKLQETIPFKWRVQSTYQNQGETYARMVPYVDARDVQEKLDSVVGASNWQDEYYSVKNTMFCKIGILSNGVWIWKSGAGVPSKTEKDKGEASDCFKRAGVKWGINRDAYTVGIIVLPTKKYGDKYYPVNNQGGFLKGQDLYDTCNKLAKIEELPTYTIEETNSLDKLA